MIKLGLIHSKMLLWQLAVFLQVFCYSLWFDQTIGYTSAVPSILTASVRIVFESCWKHRQLHTNGCCITLLFIQGEDARKLTKLLFQRHDPMTVFFSCFLLFLILTSPGQASVLFTSNMVPFYLKCYNNTMERDQMKSNMFFSPFWPAFCQSECPCI